MDSPASEIYEWILSLRGDRVSVDTLKTVFSPTTETGELISFDDVKRFGGFQIRVSELAGEERSLDGQINLEAIALTRRGKESDTSLLSINIQGQGAETVVQFQGAELGVKYRLKSFQEGEQGLDLEYIPPSPQFSDQDFTSKPRGETEESFAREDFVGAASHQGKKRFAS